MITYGSTTLTSYNTITKIEVYYYKSTSATSLSGGSWSTTKPTWENGKYIWQKIRTTYEGKLENGQYYSESEPVNITGQQGATGTSAYSYKLTASDIIVSVSKNGVYSTNNVTFSATSKQGTGNVNAYNGRFKIETTADGITWTTQYTSSANESSKTFTIPSDISNIRCSLYQAGGTTVLLDIVSVSLVKDGTDGMSQNLLLDVYASSLTKVKAPWARYLSDTSNTTITGEFIAESNLPDPNATHFYRITDSSASTKGRGLCFYNGGIPPLLNGHTYRIGCWVRNHSGKPRLYIYLGSVGEWLPHKTIENTDWEWVECVRTFGDTDPTINGQSSTYKRLYFYLSNNNVAGSSLDMCGFKMEEVQTDISTARNYLLKTEKLKGWGATGGTTISNDIATFPEVTANTWREIYPTKNFKYELIRNKNIIFSVRIKADTGKKCACNLCIGVDATEIAYTRQKYRNNFVYFTGDGEWHTICAAMPMSDEFFNSGSGTPDYDNCWVTVRIGAVNSYHNSFQLKQPQLSLGTTATAWSAAPEDVEEEISTLRIDLQSQIDEKIQTYYQSTNPATWSADERTAHDGDLWCYTGTTTSTYTKDNVYRYNASNNTWTVYSASGELFDKVDGKTTIYYGATSDTYSNIKIGDYLVDSTDGSSYRYDGSKWVKVTDYQTAINSAVTGVNLTPFFSHDLNDVYNSETNPNGYWIEHNSSYGWTKNSAYTFTQLEDGWLHVHVDNSSGTRTIRNDCCIPRYNPSIKRATKYTFLAEFRNNQSTGVASGSDFYLVQQSGSVQFWGQNVSTAPLVHLEGIGFSTVSISEVPSDGSYAFSRFTKYSEPEIGSTSHWTAENDMMVTFVFRANAGAVLDYDVRLSVYEGEYWGSYTPYIISDITDVRKSAEEANEKIDNLEVGGRNLLKWTTSPKANGNYSINNPEETDGWYAWNSLLGTITRTEDGIKFSHTSSSGSSGIVIPLAFINAVIGETKYTLSFKYRTNLTSLSAPYLLRQSNGNISYGQGVAITPSETEWQYFTAQIQWASTGDINTWALLLPYSAVIDGWIEIQDKSMKLEKGGKATDWTPAPEDTNASIQQVQDNLDNLEIGGRNLLKNSKALTDNWQLNQATVSDGVVTVTPTASGDRRMYQMPAAGYWTWTVGQEYTVSVDARSDNGASFTFVATGVASNGTVIKSPTITVTSEWKRYSFTFTAAHSSTGSMTFSIVETSDKTIQFKEPKLEHGSKATSWTPAPEDTQADIDTALAQSLWYATCPDAGATKMATIISTTTNFVLNIGTTVYVKFTNTNTGAIGDLTLNVNNTGAKNIKYIYNGSITNIPDVGYLKANQTYQFYYDGTYWVVQMMYNSNSVDRTQYGIALAASEAIAAAKIAVLGTNNKLHILNTTAFDITCPPLYVGTAYTADNVTKSTTRTSNYRYWGTAFTLTNTHSIEGAVAGKPIYIVGTLNGNIFTPNSTVLTCTEPTTENGLYYMRLGTMSTTTNGVLEMDHPIYIFYNGSFITIEEAEAEKAQNLATAVYGTCSTGATTVDKVVTCSNFTLFDGARIQITFTNANTAIASETTTASPTLNVNGTGRKPIKIGIEEANTANPLYWAAGATIEFVYDGSAWVLQNAPYTLYGTCNTEENVREKQVVCDGAVVCKGTTIYVDMLYSNTADSNSENGNVTLNVANTIAKTIYANNSTLTIRSRYNWNAGENPSFTFDGQYWQMDKDTVPAYITDKDEDGIFVHPINDTASGWSIGKVFELLNNGYSYIKMWLEDVTDNLSAKIRIGREDQHHILLDKEIIQFKKGDTPEELASFSSSGISFDDGVPFKIGNDSTYVQFVDNNSDGVADALEIVADKISFKNGGDNTVQDIQERFNDLQTDISNITNNIEINPTADTPYVAITTQKDEYNAGLKLEPTQLSFQLNGQTTATIANDEMNIPTASVTNLFMQSANQSYEKIWVMRSNGHLSLKVGKQN